MPLPEGPLKGYGTRGRGDHRQHLFPQRQVARIDADLMSKKGLRQVLSDFGGKYDLLLGTQMIAKGLDFQRDPGRHHRRGPLLAAARLPAGERVQFADAGRGPRGRGDLEGWWWWQSPARHEDPIQFAKRLDFEGFAAAELERRAEFGSPAGSHT
jgi:primosomal protein N' (replication factor Y)